MFRAVAFAARLGFSLDPPVIEAIRAERQLIASASPARLIEEYYKVLRSGFAEQTFRLLAEHGLLEPITPEIHHSATEDALWQALTELDTYRRRFDVIPEDLTNAVLLGTLLVPLGLMPRQRAAAHSTDFRPALEDRESQAHFGLADDSTKRRQHPADRFADRRRKPAKEPPLRIGLLPVARRDTERLRQILSVQCRLLDLESSPRAKRALMHRSPFPEAMVWLEIHGRAPEALEHWRGFIEASGPIRPHAGDVEGDGTESGDIPLTRRRRRRRGRRRGRGGFDRKRES
jgi:poly(A) polymerase